ncbi:MAG: hypothetical protein ILP07_11135, partial [Treponema sp.]|nr:hypothetical protein [Treponema sp.]
MERNNTASMAFVIARIVFLILAIVGLTFLLPIITALIFGEIGVLPSFLIPMAASIVLGAV